ncbi:hypothetical protein [Clostridium facile]|uniref:Uncharacterized protein n=1 Tax=Clostridium facile TaxID=2763035 RepID=A0ABR7INP8_9CLOT|nr:hypothetical protein [Clostridium facile]MBC5786751.1 hypothetical protein [Clostridium facile]
MKQPTILCGNDKNKKFVAIYLIFQLLKQADEKQLKQLYVFTKSFLA